MNNPKSIAYVDESTFSKKIVPQLAHNTKCLIAYFPTMTVFATEYSKSEHQSNYGYIPSVDLLVFDPFFSNFKELDKDHMQLWAKLRRHNVEIGCISSFDEHYFRVMNLLSEGEYDWFLNKSSFELKKLYQKLR